MKVLLLTAFISVCLSSRTILDDEWEKWKSLHSKVYDDEAVESIRRVVWESNWWYVQQHNSEEHSFQVEMNKFADLVSLNFLLIISVLPELISDAALLRNLEQIESGWRASLSDHFRYTADLLKISTPGC